MVRAQRPCSDAYQASRALVEGRKRERQPFFLYLAHRNIHGPLVPDPRFRGESDIGVYGDFLAELDWSVGEVLAALDEAELANNTLVLFTSDNDGVVQYEPIDHATINGHAVNGVLRGQKTDVYEGGVRVPLIVRWPKHVPAGSQDDSLIALTDMLATFADFFGVDLPADAGEDSFSFLGVLLDQPARQARRDAIVNDSFGGTLAIRHGDWKLILGQHGGGVSKEPIPYDPSHPPGQLFHLGRDIREASNVYKQNLANVEKLTDLLERYREEGRSAPADRRATQESTN